MSREVLLLVDALARRYERGAWQLAAQDGDYVDRMLGGIVGFELAVTRIEGKFKLSQNRLPADRLGAIAGLDDDRGRPEQGRGVLPGRAGSARPVSAR